MILDRSPEDEPLIPAKRTKNRMEMLAKKKKASSLNKGAYEFESDCAVELTEEEEELTEEVQSDWSELNEEHSRIGYCNRGLERKTPEIHTDEPLEVASNVDFDPGGKIEKADVVKATELASPTPGSRSLPETLDLPRNLVNMGNDIEKSSYMDQSKICLTRKSIGERPQEALAIGIVSTDNENGELAKFCAGDATKSSISVSAPPYCDMPVPR